MPSMQDKLRSMPTLTGTPPGAFDTDDVPLEPVTLFGPWLESAIAAGEPEPTAMTLSTVDAHGHPDARVLILKDLDVDNGWWFAGSIASAKGRQLHGHPVAALTFYWPRVGRSVRIRGEVDAADPDQSAADFRRRSLGARAVALATRQSGDLEHRQECADAVAAARVRLSEDDNLLDADWQLWRLRAESVEFWQADPQRQHTRLAYRRDLDGWSHGLLWP